MKAYGCLLWVRKRLPNQESRIATIVPKAVDKVLRIQKKADISNAAVNGGNCLAIISDEGAQAKLFCVLIDGLVRLSLLG